MLDEKSPDPTPTRREFLEFALDHMKHEHKQLSDAWKDLDSKAQGTATIAGVFLAAAFAFVRNATVVTPAEQVLFCMAVSLLVAGIVLSAASMRVRSVSAPLTGAQVAKMVSHAIERPVEEAVQRYNGLLVDTINVWADANSGLRKNVRVKAARLAHSQEALMASAFVVLLITVLVVT